MSDASKSERSDELLGNGIDAATGEYLFPATAIAQLAKLAQGQSFAAEDEERNEIRTKGAGHLAIARDGDPDRLDEAGWALVFPAEMDDERRSAIVNALAPLRERRSAQVGNEQRCRQLLCARTWTANEFLGQYGAGPGSAEPDKVPYYLLLIASPEELSFELQYDLSVQYGVGRLHFTEVASYRRYAEAVVASEQNGRKDAPSAAFFGVTGDPATERSASELVAPLCEYVEGFQSRRWLVKRYLGESASKRQLSRLLGGEDRPWLLFTASHGLGLAAAAAGRAQRVPRLHGALVCQDWPGHGAPEPEHFFSAEDLAEDVNLRGMIGFHFACFGVGTPAHNSFHDYDAMIGQPEIWGTHLAPRPFLSRLPLRMLEQGALCVIGHVDRTWSTSFRWKTRLGHNARYTTTFEDVLSRLLKGRCAGYAMEYFGLLGATLGARIAQMQRNRDRPMAPQASEQEWAYTWLCWHNARNHILLGDPAVRLPVNGQSS